MRNRCQTVCRWLLVAAALGVGACAKPTGGKQLALPPAPAAPKVIATQDGIASLYTDRRTASGERFNASALTAAHRHWPMGTKVRVINRNGGRSVVVRINDRGPFIRGRIIDLTPAAATAIGLSKKMGLARVTLERLE